jgi:hypothetical protein
MEIIKRTATVSKETIETRPTFSTKRMQVSYNNDGHLVLRFFDPNGEREDTLITLDARETWQLLNFVNNIKL